jgi:glutamine amidotransferase
MCRLLYIRSEKKIESKLHLNHFAKMAKNSKEFQGHGWGCAYLLNDNWEYYKNIEPIWEHDFENIPNTTTLLVHARSAYKDEGIIIENNMPFYDENKVFIFNGELKGVKIKSDGRIGAEKIFNYLKRFENPSQSLETFQKGLDIIEKRTEYIRAMNVIIANKKEAFVSSLFNESEEYFTLRYYEDKKLKIVCSEPYPLIKEWVKINNKTNMII